MTGIELGPLDLAIGGLVVLASAGASLALRLGVQRQLLWSALRMAAQLLLVGLVLRWVFRAGAPAAIAGVIVLMIAAAAREVAVRPSERFLGAGSYRIGAAVVGVASLATVSLALLTAIRPEPWYDPRYAIPLTGIVLGSVLNSASLGLDSFLGELRSRRAVIEARLALGDGMHEALRDLVRSAVRRGLIPLVNQMSAAGLITLPGIMTGQILAGMDPLQAVKYQILLLCLLTGAGALASIGAVLLAARSVTDERQRLRLDRLAPRR